MPQTPDILIIGAAKGGTTSLYAYLASHPDLQGPRHPENGQPLKEVHFFDHNWHRGLHWYTAHFPDNKGHAIDATPNYLALLRAHSRMQTTLPDARLVISLRNPVDRAYSHYNHYRQELPASASWDDWQRPHDSFAANVKAEMHNPSDPSHRFRGLLGKGCYADQIAHLLSFYPRKQIHVMILERWSQDPQQAWATLLDFLHLPFHPLRPAARHRRDYTTPMASEIRTQLQSFYRPHNERLFALLGYEIEEWSS